MTANKRRFSWGAVLLVLLAMCLVYYLASGLRSQDAVSYAQVRQLFLDEKVQEFAISDTRLTAKLSDGSTVSCDLYDFQVFYDDLNDLVQQQHDQGIIRDYTYHADHSTNWLQLLLPYVLVILGFILLMNLMARMTGAGPGGAQDRMSPTTALMWRPPCLPETTCATGLSAPASTPATAMSAAISTACGTP